VLALAAHRTLHRRIEHTVHGGALVMKRDDQIAALAPNQIDRFAEGLHEGRGRFAPNIVVANALVLAQRMSPSDTRKPRNGVRYVDDEQDELPQPATVAGLMERDMQAIQYLREPWIGEGLNITAGRPKLGKTTLLRQKLAAVAGGTPLWGAEGPQCGALFLSLEEGDRLARKKFEMAGFDKRALAAILIYFQWRRGKDGVLDLSRVLDKYPAVRFVGIDSLTRFRDVPDGRMPAFQCDYEAVSALHAVAKSRPGLCIDVVHHTRKAKSDDPIDDISGTFGLSAACDSYCVMRHHEDGAVIHVGGRLWELDATQYQLRRGKQRWELAGEFTPAPPGASQVQVETLDALRTAKGMTAHQVASTFSIGISSAYERLNRLVDAKLAYSKQGRFFAQA
jgi:hypothetical protein